MKKNKWRSHPAYVRRRRIGLITRMLLLTAICLAAGFFIDARIRPIVETMAAYQAKVYATRTVNDALLEQLEASGLDYGDLVKVSRREDGAITSVQTDVVAVNRMKAELASSIVAELEALEEETVLVPLGTLLGNEFVAGWGPDIKVRIIPTGYVQTELYSEFSSAGINQTHHQVMLRTSIQMTAILPGYRVPTETSTNYCIAQTVIVGEIPESFTQIQLDAAPLITKLGEAVEG